MTSSGALEAVLQRDRAVVSAGLVGISALAWAYLVWDARGMACLQAMAQAWPGGPWTAADAGLMFAMWAIMMVAMMVPSAAPMLLTFAAVSRKRREAARPFVPTGFFLAGYLIVWTTFSALATVAQWGLERTALLSGSLTVTASWLGAALLVVAGIFQFTPLKRACLVRCRTPLSFIMTEWREGRLGALMMGLRHGGFCLGCCWFLMALLFVAGVMNLAWVAAISLVVLAEKALPSGERFSRLAGAGLIVWGLCLAVR